MSWGTLSPSGPYSIPLFWMWLTGFVAGSVPVVAAITEPAPAVRDAVQLKKLFWAFLACETPEASLTLINELGGVNKAFHLKNTETLNSTSFHISYVFHIHFSKLILTLVASSTRVAWKCNQLGCCYKAETNPWLLTSLRFCGIYACHMSPTIRNHFCSFTRNTSK